MSCPNIRLLYNASCFKVKFKFIITGIMRISKFFLIILLSFSYNFAFASEVKIEENKSQDIASETNLSEFTLTDLVLGDKNAKVRVMEYFSLTCPHCAYFNREIFPELKKLFIDNNKIAYVKREFISTKQDLDAAVLARCGGDMKRIAFYDVLLKQQDSWAFNRNYNEVLTNIGQIGGISPEQYKKCLADNDLGTALMNNTKLIARTPGFIGTPVFVINNKLHNGKFSLEELRSVIEAELQRNQ